MTSREEAQAILERIHACRPKAFFGKIDDSQRGMSFVLIYLMKAEHEVLAGELAKELNVSTARIAALLKAMEKNGLIVRSHSRSDARQTVVQITQAGIAQIEAAKNHILDTIELLLERVGKAELYEFIRISDKIREALGE